MTIKRLATAAAIGLAVTVTVTAVAAGTAAALIGQPASTTSAAKPAGGAPPVDAVLVTPSFGWLLTADGLRVTNDGGATFTAVNAPLPAGGARAAAFVDARNGIEAVAAGNVIDVARTTDGGATWVTSKATDPAMPPNIGYSDLKIAFGSQNQGAILARIATGQSFSIGTLFSTADAGTSWATHPAPAAGDVSMEATGRIWMAGGLLHDNLYRSDDAGAHWTQAQVPPLPGRQVAAVSVPIAGQLSATVLNNGVTEVELLSSADQGQTWNPSSSVTVTGKTAMGVEIRVAQTVAGPLVLDTAGGHAYRLGQGTDIHPTGLPEGVDQATFAPDGRSGWALATYGQCTSGKQNCTLYHELVRTVDGGSTWQRLQTWAQPIG